jgi:glycine oxidase
LTDELFVQEQLECSAEGVSYNGIPYDAVVCCEGAYAAGNAFFSWLPFKLSKGEWVCIECEEDLGEAILHCGINIIPVGNRRYKLSSTFEWEQLDWRCSEKGQKELLDTFEKHFHTPYTIVDRGAGVRPTVADRRPYLGEHPALKGLYIFNGLGTKGVMLAPWFSRHLCEHILDGKPLMKEVDVSRYRKRFERSTRV